MLKTGTYILDDMTIVLLVNDQGDAFIKRNGEYLWDYHRLETCSCTVGKPEYGLILPNKLCSTSLLQEKHFVSPDISDGAKPEKILYSAVEWIKILSTYGGAIKIKADKFTACTVNAVGIDRLYDIGNASYILFSNLTSQDWRFVDINAPCYKLMLGREVLDVNRW